jgi:uncharacterized protein YjbI with pentapeptide repeats
VSEPSLWLSYLSPTEQQAHQRWLEAGCTGIGRIDIEGKNLTKANPQMLNLTGGRIVECDLSNSKITYGKFISTEQIECIWYDAVLQSSKFSQSLLKNCRFTAAYMLGTDFTCSQVLGGDWSKTILRESVWTNAYVENTRFQQTSFGGAKFNNAQFMECDFQGADMMLTVLDNTVFKLYSIVTTGLVYCSNV